ncbi:ABC transporter substrate-binding protein [Ferviditalea candida]|uniref:ABC transporter substrate-binding protein n=1 Tax=Ferviditalea candida TaxID=3108399 RepID=A0ABU5ZJ75_9BACL|nr:ABC transporter substrate-binding protein [Paenibacillaceae bacterium T2]
MKKSILGITMAIIVFMLVLTACGGSQPSSGGTSSKGNDSGKQAGQSGGDSAQSGGTVKIGALGDLSGKSALSGKFKKMGIDLALEEINAAGGILGKKLEVVFQDTQGTQQGAVGAFQKLVSDKDIVAVIGSIRSTNVQATDSFAKKAGIPVAIGGTNVGLTTKLGDKWYFRFRPHDGYAAKSIAEFSAKKLGYKKIAIIYDSDAFGSGGKDLLLQNYKEMGIEPVAVESYNTGNKDFTPFLQKFADKGAEAVNTYMTNSEDAGQMVNQIHEKGFKYQLIGSPSLAQEVTLKISGDNLNGVYSVNDFAADQSDATIAFVKKFKAKYNETPDVYTAWVYDALHVFAKVINEKKSTKPDDIRDGILAIKNYDGAEGNYTFDANGDGLHSYSIVKVEGGKIVTVH